jgi:hypothetical protein
MEEYMFKKTKHHWKNCKAVIKQINNNEWKPRLNPLTQSCLTAHRDGRELWLGNGSFFCDVDDGNVFGYILRHYVYHKATKKLKRKCESGNKKELIKLY